jgi:hypothetical protein
MKEWRCSTVLLYPGTSWRWVANFKPLPLYLRGRSSLCPWDKRKWAAEWAWTLRRRQKCCTARGLTRSVLPVDIPVELSQLITDRRRVKTYDDRGSHTRFHEKLKACDDRSAVLSHNVYTRFHENLPICSAIEMRRHADSRTLLGHFIGLLSTSTASVV